jgi:hypothetical protein
VTRRRLSRRINSITEALSVRGLAVGYDTKHDTKASTNAVPYGYSASNQSVGRTASFVYTGQSWLYGNDPLAILCGALMLRVLLAVVLIMQPPASLAFQTPLSEEAVREAYFLGQRHDESISRQLEKYTQYFPIPDYGPQITSVTYLTPFAQAVLASSNHIGNYSAQQAQIEHRGQHETVQIQVGIRFTDSYPAMIPSAPSSRGGPFGLVPRPSDFWHDFEVTVFDGEKALEPTSQQGRPDYNCTEYSCFLIGATILLDFPAEDFVSQDVTVQIDPPKGDQLVSNLDLSLVR